MGRRGGAGNVLPGDRHHTCQEAACPPPLCRSEAPPAEGRLQSRPRPQPGRRCHPSCFCFSAGRCSGSSGVRMRTRALSPGHVALKGRLAARAVPPPLCLVPARDGVRCETGSGASSRRPMSPVLKAPSATVPTVECPHRRMFASGRHRAPGGVPPDIRWPAQWTYVSSSPFHQEKEKRKKKKKEGA